MVYQWKGIFKNLGVFLLIQFITDYQWILSSRNFTHSMNGELSIHSCNRCYELYALLDRVIKPALISGFAAWRGQEYLYPPLEGMLVHHRVTCSINLPVPTWVERGTGSNMSCSRTQHNVPDKGLNPDCTIWRQVHQPRGNHDHMTPTIYILILKIKKQTNYLRTNSTYSSLLAGRHSSILKDKSNWSNLFKQKNLKQEFSFLHHKTY